MTRETRHGNGASGNGSGGFGGGFDDSFDDFIRDRETEHGAGWDDPHDPDPYADFGGGRRQARQPGIDRALVEAITRLLDGLVGVAGEALAPELRRRVQKALRELLVVLRDIIDALIASIDGHRDEDLRVEEIPID